MHRLGRVQRHMVGPTVGPHLLPSCTSRIGTSRIRFMPTAGVGDGVFVGPRRRYTHLTALNGDSTSTMLAVTSPYCFHSLHYSTTAEGGPHTDGYNHNGRGRRFKVSIFTGNQRGAGTRANVFIKIFGTNGSTDDISLEGEEFERSTVVDFDVAIDSNIGNLTSVQIGHDNTNLGAGWYVDHIEIAEEGDSKDTLSPREWFFPCEKWLGESDSGGLSGPPVTELPAIARSEGEETIPHHAMSPSGDCCSAHVYSTHSHSYVPSHVAHHDNLDSDVGEGIPVTLRGGGTVIPHPDKVREGARATVKPYFGSGGEDAYIIHSNKKGGFEPDYCLLGVADGVYEWNKHGVDAGDFSRAFLRTARAIFDVNSSRHSMVCPVRLMHSSWDSLHVTKGEAGADGEVEGERKSTARGKVRGSSTVCLVVVDGATGRLKAANIGDSGYMVIRDGHPVFRTPQQEHSFGYPFQLGFGLEYEPLRTHPSDADTSSLHVIPGDVIVAGTDGLWDNLHEHEIIESITSNRFQSPGVMARTLAAMAFNVSLDRAARSPFSLAATDEFNMVYNGGKKDDITVAVVIAGERKGL